MKKLLALCISLFCISSAFTAEQTTLPHISVYGTATLDVTPDKMEWAIAITNKGLALDKIAEDHLKTVQNTLKLLRELGVDEKSLNSSEMRFGENIVYRNNEHIKEGYYASSNISFQLTNLGKYGEIWKALAKNENTSIQNVSFDTSKRIKYQNETRNNAILAAKAKATDMAKTLGVEIGEPLALEEVLSSEYYGNNFRNAQVQTNGEDEDTSAQSVPGKIVIRMRVSAVFRLISPAK